ncbi:MAG: acyltransferase family protein [Phocaeicola sp.]
MEKNKVLPPNESTAKKKRLLSIDVLRGMTVIGMILVNNGAGALSYAPLRHSDWNGLTFCDLVFPFFLFIMGISVYISLSKINFTYSSSLLRKIVKRTLLIIFIGWGINWFAHACMGNFFPFETLRLTGVLPRIALCYFVASLLSLFVTPKRMIILIATLWVSYALFLLLGNGYAADESNLLSVIDKALIGSNHLYGGSPIDPEGLMSTLPSIAHTLIGFICGGIIVAKMQLELKMLKLFVLGAILLLGGFLLIDLFPLNKIIWSPTFIVVTCGMAILIQATLLYFIDWKGEKKWCRTFEIFGVNPLFLYVFSELLAIVVGTFGIKVIIYEAIEQFIGNPYAASLLYAILFTSFMGALGYLLYRKRIFIKL